ncbi:LytTR family DNA-binding domain-containing protein [Paraflavitalea sp. CAU 1676]|uniref:LytR/AlgR family response regulator transcription factor n=1 Tax=Paraflavitalea sp. CAU 1676 TaxID=3032598 RepID=UPI0023DCB672|nr:LytTR family DNA-binding domain-containing protein [Paraflavitalea sp. CAU 1676]MDF2190381.1 LytTR family DNA-binding domain-containing protein [Paraflavitalea sp. CAU 1676]
MKYKAVIVEDESMNSDFLQHLLVEFCPEIALAGTAAVLEDAVALIDRQQPQVVFMDIELQTATGFDVLQQVKHRDFEIIFTTAFDHYAIQAIKVSAIDYLLKPINFEELQTAVSKALERLQDREKDHKLELLMKNIKRPSGEDFSISLSTSEGVEFVPLSQIMRLEAKGPYTTFFMKGGGHLMVCKNLKEYELLLTDHGFFRLHNSYMVNMKEVKKLVKADGGYAVMNDGTMIAISPRKKDEFMTLMAQRLV